MPKYECSKCGEEFGNGDELANHIRDAHGGGSAGPSFECKICSARFGNEADLVSHMSGAHPRG